MRLVIEMLIGCGADVTECRVTSSSIIERFDVEEKVSPGFVASVVHSVTRKHATTILLQQIHELAVLNCLYFDVYNDQQTRRIIP
jgi:hypothetical protein